MPVPDGNQLDVIQPEVAESVLSTPDLMAAAPYEVDSQIGESSNLTVYVQNVDHRMVPSKILAHDVFPFAIDV